MISAQQILSTYQIIRPHIRRTPVVDVDGADFGIDTPRLALKLESLQHAGSFKSRGAFTNLPTRKLPAAGVVAASGGNHGAAVAFAAMKCSVPAKIFVPNIASSTKIQLFALVRPGIRRRTRWGIEFGLRQAAGTPGGT